MQLHLYTIYDKVAKEYAPPFVAKNHQVATRSYMQGIKNVVNPMEYVLYCIGRMDMESAKIDSYVPEEIIPDFNNDGV